MADFTTNQAQLAAARSALDKAQQAASKAAAQAQKAQAALDLATRQQMPRQDGEGGNLAQLAGGSEASAAAAAMQRRRHCNDSRASLAGIAGQFAVFTDPRQNVERLSDAVPFLLFPVRIETRFRTIVSQAPPGIAVPPVKHQLWVRIYPDDCSIDTFEPIPSDSELANIKSYWMNTLSRGWC